MGNTYNDIGYGPKWEELPIKERERLRQIAKKGCGGEKPADVRQLFVQRKSAKIDSARGFVTDVADYSNEYKTLENIPPYIKRALLLNYDTFTGISSTNHLKDYSRNYLKDLSSVLFVKLVEARRFLKDSEKSRL